MMSWIPRRMLSKIHRVHSSVVSIWADSYPHQPTTMRYLLFYARCETRELLVAHHDHLLTASISIRSPFLILLFFSSVSQLIHSNLKLAPFWVLGHQGHHGYSRLSLSIFPLLHPRTKANFYSFCLHHVQLLKLKQALPAKLVLEHF